MIFDPKDIFTEEHERLIEEELDKLDDPNATDMQRIYDETVDAAYDAMRDRYADMADEARQRMKDEGR